jgi:hypothetical protein
MIGGRDNRTPHNELGPYDTPRESGQACRTCRYWTPATYVYYATCHNTKAGLGAHIRADGDGWCKEYEAREEKDKTG